MQRHRNDETQHVANSHTTQKNEEVNTQMDILDERSHHKDVANNTHKDCQTHHDAGYQYVLRQNLHIPKLPNMYITYK